MLGQEERSLTGRGSAPEPTGGWNGAAGLVAILAAQVHGAALVLAVACWRSTVTRIWTAAATAVLLIAAAVLFQLGDDEQVLARSLLIVAACVTMILLDTLAATDRRPPSLLCMSVFGAWISFALMIPIMVARPYDSDDMLWAVLYRSPAVETVQWMTVVGVLSFGSALLASRYILGPFERWWSAAWDRRFTFAEGDGGFTLGGFLLVGVSVFLLKIVFVGYGYLASGNAPAGTSWIFSGLYFIYYLSIYAANARMLAQRRFHLPTVGLDVLALAYEISSGSKGRFVGYVLFPLMLVAVFQRRRLSWSTAGSLGAVVLVAVFVVYPLLFSYRAELSASVDPGRPEAAMMSRATSSWSDAYEDKIAHLTSVGGPAEQVLASTSLVFFDVRHDANHFWERLAFFWVPRVIWPDKAEALSGNELGKESHRLDSRSQTSVLQTGLGELYVYFGFAGALGFFVTGITFRFIDLAYSCFRVPQFLRIAASVCAFREMTSVVTGEFETGTTSQVSSAMILLSLLAVLALAATVFSGTLGASLDASAARNPARRLGPR